MALQSTAACLPYKDLPTSISKLPIVSNAPKYTRSRCARRRLLVTNSGPPQGKEPTKEIGLDKQDLMTIEFGRLLGESKEQTIAKVLRRKLDPNSTYIKLEKEAKAGKELIKQSDFTLKAEWPQGTSRNDSTGTLHTSFLASNPPRQNTGFSKFPKSKEQEIFDDLLLRRPVSTQSSKSVSAITSSKILKTDKSKDAIQHMKSVDLHTLRRPSLDKGSNALKGSLPVFPLKSDSNSVSQEAMIENNKKMPKLEKASGASTSNIASMEKRINSSLEPNAGDGSKQVDAAAALPSLASPPSRHPVSIATSIQQGKKRNQATGYLPKNLPDESLEELLLKKPAAHRGSTLTSAQSNEELCTSQDDQSLIPLTQDRSDFLEASALPQLAVPRSRQEGLIGKFAQPRGASFESLKDSSVDDSLIRKPIIPEKGLGSLASTTQSESIDPTDYQSDDLRHTASEQTSQVSSSRDKAPSIELERSSKNNSQMISTSNDLSITYPEKGSEMKNASVPENEPSDDVVLKRESLSQSHKQPVKSRTSDALKLVKEVCNASFTVEEVDRSDDVSKTFGINSATVTLLGRPARNSSLDLTKGPPSEEMKHTIPDNLDCNEHTMTVGEQEQILNTSSKSKDLVSESNLPSSIPKEEAFGHPQREQEKQVTVGSETEQTKAINLMRRPSQNVEFSPQLSKLTVLETSNRKLHQAKEEEEKDWARAESSLKTKELIEVKIIGSSSAGLVVSLGCLVGSIPSFELNPKRGVADFGSWAQQKGYVLSQGKPMNFATDELRSLTENLEEGKHISKTEADLNDLRIKYHEETSKLLASFVGERTKVIVKLLDKGRRKLRVSEKEAEPGYQEHLQKKANLMAKLKLGEVVECQVKSITPIGVFVEVDNVAALIHHSELSWNTRTDPAALFSIGEVIKAKVCRLDRTLQRISLSLKQMQPDPLKRTLESVIEDIDTDSSLYKVAARASLDENWPELGDIIEKLEQMDHISRVSKGRCLYSAAFAPSFQVLISTPQLVGYKLLARFENKIQEILVDTTLDREKMKECIRLCTFAKA